MSKRYRQHPLMILISLLEQTLGILSYVLIFVLARFISGEGEGFSFGLSDTLFIVVPVVLVVLTNVLRWIFFTYQYDGELIEIQSGIFIKKERKIKVDRIQAINLDASLLLRLFGLTRLTIETAGNLSESEVEIKALKLKHAHRIKDVLSHPNTLHEDPSESALVKVEPFALFMASLTSGGALFTGIAVVFFALQFISFLEFNLDFENAWQIAVALLVLTFVVLMLGWIVSIVRYILQYAMFTLINENDELKISRGLLHTRSSTIALKRIQAVHLIQGILRQPFGYVAIEAKVAGGRTEDSLASTLLHPFIHKRELNQFMATLFPDYQLPTTYISAPRRALTRYLLRASWLFIFMMPFVFIFPYLAFGFVLWPVSLAYGFSRHKNAKIELTHTQLNVRYRLFRKNILMIPRHHIQAVAFEANVLQRWQRLAHLNVYVLSSPQPTEVKIKDINVLDANTVYDSFSQPKGFETYVEEGS